MQAALRERDEREASLQATLEEWKAMHSVSNEEHAAQVAALEQALADWQAKHSVSNDEHSAELQGLQAELCAFKEQHSVSNDEHAQQVATLEQELADWKSKHSMTNEQATKLEQKLSRGIEQVQLGAGAKVWGSALIMYDCALLAVHSTRRRKLHGDSTRHR